MTRHGPSLELAEQVAGRVGLSFSASRKETVASAIDRVMVRRGIGEGRLLLDRLGSDEDLTEDVISAVTVAETHFFRGPEQFELIRQTILPELLRRRPEGSPLRIWSVGCATGEEPYSLAILCEEEGLLDGVRIDAADISRRALAAAKAGDYGEWALRNTGPRLRQRYFTSCEGRFRLNERLRRQVDFAHLNLGTDALPAPEKRLSDFDLILCRNVLVYLEASAVRRIARQLLGCLSNGGWLLTAPTDPPLWKYAPFETSITPAGIVYRRIMAPDTRKSSTACVAPVQRQTGNPVAGVPLARARAAASGKRPATIRPRPSPGKSDRVSTWVSPARPRALPPERSRGIRYQRNCTSLKVSPGWPAARPMRRRQHSGGWHISTANWRLHSSYSVSASRTAIRGRPCAPSKMRSRPAYLARRANTLS